MASFLAQVQTIQRSAGRSVVAAAAYRSGQNLTDERLAMEFNFAAKEGVQFAEILAPDTAPAAFQDRQTLWNAAEKSEARKGAVPAREILLGLPHELDLEQRRALVRDFVERHVVARGMIADVAMHELDLTQGVVLERGCVYIAELQERLTLPRGVSARANPSDNLYAKRVIIVESGKTGTRLQTL